MSPDGGTERSMGVYRILYEMIDPSERRRAWTVFGLTLLMAFVEALGIASIMPFMAVLAQPEVIDTNPYLHAMYEQLGFDTKRSFLIFLGVATFLLLVGATAVRGLALWAQLRFTNLQSHALACRLVSSYLSQPYPWFLNRHSSQLAVNVLSEVSNVIYNAYFPAMAIIANTAISAFLLAILVAVDPVLALSAALVLGGSYVGIYMLARVRLERYGEERLRSNQRRHLVLNEMFGGIKEVKLLGIEQSYLARFEEPSLRMARSTTQSEMFGSFPSLAIQVVVFGGMLLVLIYLMAYRGGLAGALPVAALYALAGYRLMPALQAIYGSLAKLRMTMPSVLELRRDLEALHVVRGQLEVPGPRIGDRVVRPARKIELRDVGYTYPGASKPALSAVGLVIPAYATIGLVGSTGSGKTTLVDIVLGLLTPRSGELLVDGKEVTPNDVRSWQKTLGYVPQNIFLADDTIAANIAFGASGADIDMDAVERAARIANLHEFIVDELPEGYRTAVGERGVRLSGGQRQRIGIARALYHDPDVLIFDEATSALDNLTEKAVMEAVYRLGNKKTIVMIAHRLSTVRACDRIYLLEQGRVVASGTYDDLIAREERFRVMVSGNA